ncbi:probable endochitinase isoform X2 [Periplaneta americana]|uniref:probable endochitinase isoform X2 n=1 Tax=Periplaneta americana TaxID=6978 RepID=UPI0037E88B16
MTSIPLACVFLVIAPNMILSLTITTMSLPFGSFNCPGVGIYPDPLDCHNFYMCGMSGIAWQGTCMRGTGTYDAVAGVCKVTGCTGAPSTTTASSAFQCTSVGLFPDPDNCHKFYSCDKDMQAIPGQCMNGKGSFDPDMRVCENKPCTSA